MKRFKPFLLGLFSAFPALLTGACVLPSLRREYYWSSYVATVMVYFVASFFLGIIFPRVLRAIHIDHPWSWLLIAGTTAWLSSLFFLGLLNLTPLCVGQDNGDGINNYSLCILYTMLIVFLYSPLELILISLNAVIGGKILSRLIPVKMTVLSK